MSKNSELSIWQLPFKGLHFDLLIAPPYSRLKKNYLIKILTSRETVSSVHIKMQKFMKKE